MTGPILPPFVGRQPELDVLRHSLERALGGNGGLAIVSGEAGIGKTTWSTEFPMRRASTARSSWTLGRTILALARPTPCG
jgi:predicted ATPase